MTKKERESEEKQLKKENQVLRFANGMRGQYILSQSLHYGIEALKKVEKPYREESNIADMELLRNVLYPMFTPPEELAKHLEALEQAKKILKAEGIPVV
jgi:hypothetical protein